MSWKVRRMGPVTTGIDIEFRRNSEWEQWALLTSDRHLDNAHTNRDLQIHHLKQAKERDAFVIDTGDMFDAMQGKTDRRSRKKDQHSKLGELIKADRSYLNALIQDAADFFKPYTSNLAMIGKGNHETSVDNKLEFDLTETLLYALSVQGGEHILNGGYRGWVKFMFVSSGKGSQRQSLNLFYTHGYGGGGPVTKDIIQVNRKAVYLDNCDIVVSGHTHDQWWFPIRQVSITERGKEYLRTQHHLKIPTYKEEYLDQPDGFHHETGKPPKMVGAWWIRFYFSNRSERVEVHFYPADS